MMNKRSLVQTTALAGCLLSVALFLAAGQSAVDASLLTPYSVPQWGPDVQVNATVMATISTAVSKNVSFANSPANRDNVIASYESLELDGAHSDYARSTDAGRTWLAGRFNGPWGQNAMDPIGITNVGYDSSGVGYYTSLAGNSTMSGYFVLTSTNGLAWSTPVSIAEYAGNVEARYQPSMAVDHRTTGPNAGSVYMFWLYSRTDVPTYYDGIWLRYSRDGGRTWSNDVQASDPGHVYGRGPSADVASDGTVYVAFEITPDNNPDNAPSLYLTRSTDNGITWDVDHKITGAPITRAGIPDFKNRELTLEGGSSCNLVRLNHFPSMAVSPADPNTIYVAWNDGRWDTTLNPCTGPGRHSDIAFSRSTNAGQTWSAPIRVNDDPMANGIDQFQPTLNVKSDGTVGITWYDRRYSADGFFYDLAYSQSTDAGQTWSANQRVSDTSSDPYSLRDYKGIDDLGYHKTLVFGPDYALPGWVHARLDARIGDVYADHGSFPLSTPTTTSTAIPQATNTRTPIPTIPLPTTTPASCTLTFTDVPSDNTFYPSVRCLACRGILSGYNDGSFKPNNLVTRGQLAKIVSNAANFTEDPGAQIFEDVALDSTFYQWINRLTHRGYMSGYNCGGPGEPCVNNRPYFRPTANATRSQTSKIVANAKEYNETPTEQTFEDVPTTHPFYLWIQRLASHGVMGGYNCGGAGEPCGSANRPYFRPFNNVTRGQSAKIVANTFYPDCQTPAKR